MAELRRGRAADERPQDLQRVAGVSLQEARAWIEAQDPEGPASEAPDLTRPLAVWPCNWPVLQLFLRLQTQWSKAPNGRPEGLNYPAVQARMWGLNVGEAERTRLWDELDDMEHAVLEAWDEL